MIILNPVSRMIESKTNLVKTLMTMVPAFADRANAAGQDTSLLKSMVWVKNFKNIISEMMLTKTKLAVLITKSSKKFTRFKLSYTRQVAK